MATAETKIEIEYLKNLLENKSISDFKIIAFGSFVNNKMHDDSDIDLIVISSSFRGKNIFEKAEMVKGVNRKLVKKLELPVDILYYSDEEWEEEDSLIINEVKQNGIVLYS